MDEGETREEGFDDDSASVIRRWGEGGVGQLRLHTITALENGREMITRDITRTFFNKSNASIPLSCFNLSGWISSDFLR